MASYFRTRLSQVPNPYYTNFRWKQRKADWYVQKPYTGAPNYYALWYDALTYVNPDGSGDAPNQQANYDLSSLSGGFSGASDRVLQACYGKFKDAAYNDAAQFAVNWAEKREAINAIAKHATAMRAAWNALRRGNLGAAAGALGIKNSSKSPWSRPQQAADIWLEWHFGWDPLIKDIYAAVHILQDEFPTKRVQARAKEVIHSDSKTVNIGNIFYSKYSGSLKYLLQGEMIVTNNNLFRADALGLLNPFSVAWELIPFSFVVDWFIPVGQFLNSYTDFSGVTWRDAFTTRSRNVEGSQYWTTKTAPFTVSGEGSSVGWRVLRTNGLTIPSNLVPKALKGPSVIRAATAISLLIGALSAERRFYDRKPPRKKK